MRFSLFHFNTNKDKKMTIKDIRILFGPSEFDREIKNNHLKQELNMNDKATVEFIEQDEYGFYTYEMTISNGQKIYILTNRHCQNDIITTKKHNFD